MQNANSPVHASKVLCALVRRNAARDLGTAHARRIFDARDLERLTMTLAEIGIGIVCVFAVVTMVIIGVAWNGTSPKEPKK